MHVLSWHQVDFAGVVLAGDRCRCLLEEEMNPEQKRQKIATTLSG